MVEVDDTSRIPINTTNATIKIIKGKEFGMTVTVSIKEQVVSEAKSSDAHKNAIVTVEKIVAPKEYVDEIINFINKNRNVIVNPDKELVQTQSVRTQIYTGKHLSIKFKPYQTTQHKRKSLDDAVEDMLRAGATENSTCCGVFQLR